MAARRGGHPSGAPGEARESVFANWRAEESPPLANARAMDGRARPGHNEKRESSVRFSMRAIVRPNMRWRMNLFSALIANVFRHTMGNPKAVERSYRFRGLAVAQTPAISEQTSCG
jgi:hypothetical protein